MGSRPSQLERHTPILLCLLFSGALVVRVWALDWGLPYVEHFDEPALLETSIQMVRNGDPNPHRFLYPSLFLYLLAAAVRAYGWWHINQGVFSSLQDIPHQHYQFTETPQLFVWARAVTAVLGAATIPALYLLGRRMFDLRVGLLAALLLMVLPFHVAHSHYITTDAPTGLWVVLALLAAWRVVVTGSWRGYIMGGVMVGLAAGTKYNAAIVAFALPIAHLLFWQRRQALQRFSRLMASGIAALLTFLVTTPYALLDWSTFRADLHYNSVHYAEGLHGDFIGRWQLGEYLIFLWRDALFPPALIGFVVAIPIVLRYYPRQTVMLLSILIAGLVLLMAYPVNFVRNLLPILPVMPLLVAAGLITFVDLIRRPMLRYPSLAALSMLVLVMPLQGTSWQLRYWSRPYTMHAAAEVVRQLPKGMRFAVEITEREWNGNPIVFPVKQLIERPIEWYRANGFRYLVTNDDFHSPQDKPIYDELRTKTTVLIEYPRRRLGIQPGPGGAVIDLGEHLEEMVFVRTAMRFGEQIELLGYELQPGELRTQITPLEGADVRDIAVGESLQINMYWRAQHTPNTDYTLFVHMLDHQGQRVAQRDLPLRHADYPTSHWKPGEMVIDRADLALPALAPGEYRLLIGLYDAAGGGQGLPAAMPEPTLATITIH